jgi:phosphoesterase RecJ-like protein
MINRFKSLIARANRIVISTHFHPDADGIGSQVALSMALRKLNKEVFCVNEEALLDRYSYLDSNKQIFSAETYRNKLGQSEIDLFILTDSHSLERAGSQVSAIAREAKEILFIDHHPCPKEYLPIHCIDTSKSATGELVGVLIESLGIKFDQEMALPLYTAMLIDTSSFRYPSVTSSTHLLVSKLMETGISPSTAYNLIYGTKKISHLKLLGKVLSEASINKKETIAWITLKRESISEFEADPEDTLAYINHLLVLDIKIACMFRELEGNKVKVSLRSIGVTDVGILAQALGGGGHNHSSAAVLDGKLDDVVDEVVEKLELMLEI